ncbi:unnamed protein product [Brassica oleracea]
MPFVDRTEICLNSIEKYEDKHSLHFSEKNVYYQTLCEKYPSFRDRSENAGIVVEISLQPWKVFKPDGVLLFSDVLTPLSGMNIPFDIVKGKGPIIFSPPQSAADVDQVREFVPEESVPYVGEALKRLRIEVVGNEAAVLGFVGAPFTLSSYVIECGLSKNFTRIKRLAFSQLQIFDSWATELSPVDFEEFSLPYLKNIVEAVKQLTHTYL